MLVEQERATEAMRKRVYDQELREEREAKQRVKESLMEALVGCDDERSTDRIISDSLQLRPDANVNQVLKTEMQTLESKRDQKAAPIMPNLVRSMSEGLPHFISSFAFD